MTKRKKSYRLLLVEDNPADVRLVQEVIEEGEISVDLSVAMDGEEAIRLLEKAKNSTPQVLPDIMLLDLNLPKKNGKEVLHFVKNDFILKRIPIIVLTTSSSNEDILDMYDLHANCYINKPVDFDEFFNVIKMVEEFWLNVVILPNSIR
ncbi:MAG: response regulator [Saprospiraceae bacterium]